MEPNNLAVAEDIGQLTLNLLLLRAAIEPVQVSLSSLVVLPEYATNQLDYTIVQPIITFAPGETQKTVTVTILPDLLDEADERFRIIIEEISGSNAFVASGSGEPIITILDDDPATSTPTLSPTSTQLPTATAMSTASPSPTATATPLPTPTSTIQPAQLWAEIEPVETVLLPNQQFHYTITTQNLGGEAAEDVMLELQLPEGLMLVNPQPLAWQEQADQRYLLELGPLPPLATHHSLILLTLSEDMAAGETILTPALSLRAANEVTVFELAVGSGANVVVLEEAEGALEPTQLSTTEEPHRTVRLFLPIIAR